MSNPTATPHASRHPYSLVGGIAAAAIGFVVLVAYIGVGGLGLFTLASAMFALGSIAIVLAIGLGYVLFTLRGSLSEMRTTSASVASRLARLEAESASSSAPTTIRVDANPWSPLPARKGAHAERARSAPSIDIEGIGPAFASRFQANGVLTVGDVKSSNPEVLAAAIRVNVATFRQWQSMADLMELNGVGKQYSELLVRSGVDSVDALASRSAPALLASIEAAQSTNQGGAPRQVAIQKSTVTLDRVEEWIAEAKRIA